MYRYFLFHCDIYYPSGGMNDCVLKTNDYTELAPFINANYNDNLCDHIHYYDAWEDKTYNAVMEEYENENYFIRQRFCGWKED